MIPIVVRPDAAMHLRHKSYMGLLLDQLLCSELTTRYTVCHVQVHPKAIIRHYRDQYQEKIGPANIHMAFVQGLVNFGSGRGQCPLYRTKTINVWIHHCCVVFQLAAMTNHMFQPTNFPIMPCMKRAWHPSMASDVPDDIPLPAPAAKKRRRTLDLTETPTNTPGAGHQTQPPDSQGFFLYKYSQYQACFLNLQGLHQHQLIYHEIAESIRSIIDASPRRGRSPGRDTIQIRPTEPASMEIPIPIQDYICSL